MTALEKYHTRLHKKGGSIRQEKIRTTKRVINHVFRDDPSYFVVPINGIEQEVRIYDKNTFTVEYSHKYIQFLDYDYFPVIGSYVYWNDRYWLLILDDDGDDIQNKGLIRECNYPLRWINDEGELIECWCCFEDRQRFSSGETKNMSLVTGVIRSELMLPKDSETIKIPRNKRFIIDDYERAQIHPPLVYKMTKPNVVERSRFDGAVYQFMMQEDSFDEVSDNRELMIANYYDRVKNDNIEFITSENIEVGVGETFQINAFIRRGAVKSNTGITYKSFDETIATVTSEGLITGLEIGETQIELQFHSTSKIVTVNVVESRLLHQNSCKIFFADYPRLKIGGASKKFTAVFYDGNGVKMNDIAQWTIYDEQYTSDVPYVSIVSRSSDSIVIKAHENIDLVGKKFCLKLTGTSGFTKDIIEIEITSLT